MLAGVLIVAAVVVVLTQQGDGEDEAAGFYTVPDAAISEDAALAWSKDAPDGLRVGNVAQLGDDAVLAVYPPPYSPEEGEEADGEVVAYDLDGDERWSVTGSELEWARPSLDREVVFVDLGDELVALDAADGEELWSVSGESQTSFEADGVLLVTIEEERTVVIDVASGEETAEVDGKLVGAPSTDSFVVQDEDTVHHVDLSGEEIWALDTEELDLDTDETLMGAFGDGLFVMTDYEGRAPLVALDPDTGEELWSETGRHQVQYRGVDGAVAVLRWQETDGDDDQDPEDGSEDGSADDGGAAELVLFDADGEQDAVELDWATRFGLQGFLEVDGADYFVTPENGTVVGSDLEILAEHDARTVGYTTEGIYLQDEDELTLADWDGEDEQFTIELEDEGWVRTLDGAIAVTDDDSSGFDVYR